MSESLSFNLTQLKDLEYICELAQLYLKGTGGQWPERIERTRGQLLNRIEELEAQMKLASATSQQEIREALKGWTPEELAERGIV